MSNISETITPLDLVNALNSTITEVSGKQDALVSGTNIKTVNSTSILGEGDLSVATSSQGSKADSALQPSDVVSTYSATGTLPVNGTAVADALSDLDIPTVDQTYSASSTNAQSGTAIASALSPITTVIPSAASSTNQLADKAFVNSSISTNTAVFRGTFESVEALNAYTGEKTNNDYAFVETTDSAGNSFYDRYKYNGTAWVYEFKINNTTFTSTQWAALDSGVNSSVVAKATSALQQSDVVSTYNSTGTLPVNGTAIADALSDITIPIIDQTYNASSTNAQSGTAVAYALGTILPTQTSNSGKFLTTDGTVASWATVDALPSQEGEEGKFLTTDGTVASWATVSGGAGGGSYSTTCPAITPVSGVATWVVTHNLGTRNVVVSLYDNNSAELMRDVTIDSINQITVTFKVSENITAGDYRIVVLSAGGTPSITIDDSLSTSSTNPVQNSVITTALNNKLDSTAYVVDTTLSQSSTNPVRNSAVYSALSTKANSSQWEVSVHAFYSNATLDADDSPSTYIMNLANYLPQDGGQYLVICNTTLEIGRAHV